MQKEEKIEIGIMHVSTSYTFTLFIDCYAIVCTGAAIVYNVPIFRKKKHRERALLCIYISILYVCTLYDQSRKSAHTEQSL